MATGNLYRCPSSCNHSNATYTAVSSEIDYKGRWGGGEEGQEKEAQPYFKDEYSYSYGTVQTVLSIMECCGILWYNTIISHLL